MKLQLKHQDTSIQGICMELLFAIIVIARIWKVQGLQTVQVINLTRKSWQLGHNHWQGQILVVNIKYLSDREYILQDLAKLLSPTYTLEEQGDTIRIEFIGPE